MGIEQERSNIYVAEENSPVDCFRWRGNKRSEAIGALRRKIPITCSKTEVTLLCDFCFLVLVGIEQGRSNVCVAEENSPVDCFRWRGNER